MFLLVATLGRALLEVTLLLKHMLDVVVDGEVFESLPELLDSLLPDTVPRTGSPQVVLRDHLLHEEGRHVLQREALNELVSEVSLCSVAFFEILGDCLSDVVLNAVLEFVEAYLARRE